MTLRVVPFFLFATACIQAPPPASHPYDSELRVEDGAIHFRDIDAFSRIMSRLHDHGVSSLDEFEQQIGFSDSLRSARLEQEHDPSLDAIDIKDAFFATAVNRRGVFYIGDTVHKIGSEYEYAQEGGDEESLARLIADNEASPRGNLIVHRILGQDRRQASLLPHFSGMESIIKGIGTDPGGAPKRVVMEAWSRNYLTYASNGVNLTTESYRKTCGLCSKKWRDSAVPYLKVTVQSRQYSSITGTGYWFVLNSEEEVYSYHHIQEVMDYVVGTGVWIDTDYIDCTYTYIPDDYIRRDDFVHWVN